MRKLLIATAIIAILVSLTAGSCEPAPTPEPTEAPGAYLAAMTSAQFASTISNETGTGVVVFGTSPSITTPTIATPTITGTLIGGAFTTITSGTWQGSSVAFSYMQLTRGRTSIPSGSATASVTHNLSTTPTQVLLSWIDTTAVDPMTASQIYLYATVLSSTTFTVNVGAALNNRPSIAWLAIP